MSATTRPEPTTDPDSRTPPQRSPTDAEATEEQDLAIGTGTDLSPESASTATDTRTTMDVPDRVPAATLHPPELTVRDTVATRLTGDLPVPVTLTAPRNFHTSEPEHTVPVDPLPRLTRIPRIDPAALPSAFSRVRFEGNPDRDNCLVYALGAWLHTLTTPTNSAPEHLAAFLKTPATLSASSIRNAILTAIQEPGAIQLHSYDTWQNRRREVEQGEQAIWTWWTTTAPRCPDCGHGPRTHHADTDCPRNPDTESWGYGPVNHSPRPAFDYAQTTPNPLDAAYLDTPDDPTRTPTDVVDHLPRLGGNGVTIHMVSATDYPGSPTTSATLTGWDAYSGTHHVYVNQEAGPTMQVRDTITTVAQARSLPLTTTPTREQYPGRMAEADAAASMVLHLLNTPPADGFDPARILGAWFPLSPNRLLTRLDRVTTLANSMRRILQIPLS